MVIKYNGIITPSIQSEEYNRIQLENKEIRRDYNFEILTSSDVKNLITKTVNIQTSFKFPWSQRKTIFFQKGLFELLSYNYIELYKCLTKRMFLVPTKELRFTRKITSLFWELNYCDNLVIKSRWVRACNFHTEPSTDWSIVSIPFLLRTNGSSGPITLWRQLVSGHGTHTGVSFQGNSI